MKINKNSKEFLLVIFIVVISISLVKADLNSTAENSSLNESLSSPIQNPDLGELYGNIDPSVFGGFDYFDFLQRIIQNNPGYLNFSEEIIHSGDYFENLIRQIQLDGDNFSSFERTILLYNSVDLDHDGYFIFTYPGANTNQPHADCNDRDINIYPGAAESCNNIDDDCDGKIDESACQCNDGLDNEGDDLIDKTDPGCWTEINDPKSYSPLLNKENRAGSECSQRSDCGEDGFVGTRYCILNGVYMDYRYAVCSNKGTGVSQCGSSIERKYLGSCVFGCENGQCKKASSQPSALLTEIAPSSQIIDLNSAYVETTDDTVKEKFASIGAFQIYLFILLGFSIIIVAYLIFLLDQKNKNQLAPKFKKISKQNYL